MHLIALDTVQISSVQADPLLAGHPFEIDEADGKILIDRGIARVATAEDPKAPEKPVPLDGAVSVNVKQPTPKPKP